ncbi:hypothetical protein FDECE_4146 [Fusarium decemcellulare]|nr:hypothetical protein FDECE_4146 [Fusarium decemcellulare]
MHRDPIRLVPGGPFESAEVHYTIYARAFLSPSSSHECTEIREQTAPELPSKTEWDKEWERHASSLKTSEESVGKCLDYGDSYLAGVLARHGQSLGDRVYTVHQGPQRRTSLAQKGSLPPPTASHGHPQAMLEAIKVLINASRPSKRTPAWHHYPLFSHAELFAMRRLPLSLAETLSEVLDSESPSQNRLLTHNPDNTNPFGLSLLQLLQIVQPPAAIGHLSRILLAGLRISLIYFPRQGPFQTYPALWEPLVLDEYDAAKEISIILCFLS